MKRKAISSNAPIAKRVKRLERVARQQRPEMKTITSTFQANIAAKVGTTKGFLQSQLLAITQGDAINQRSGNRVKVWRVEVRGIMATRLDGYLLQMHGNVEPAVTDFINNAYGSYLIESSNNTTLTEWANFSSLYIESDGNARFKISRNFKGMEVKYSGSTSNPVENGISLAFVNNFTATLPIDCSIRVWYTDP